MSKTQKNASHESAIEEMEAVCEKLGIKVVPAELTGDGMSSGGLCKVRGEWRVIVDKRAPAGERVSVLARALCSFDLEDVFVSPKVREVIALHAGSVPPPGG